VWSAAGKRWVASLGAGDTVAEGSDSGAATAKLAMAYQTGDLTACKDGAILGSITPSGLSSPTNLWIGQRDGAALWFNGHIGRIDYYSQRLPNVQMQALTA
jgi:hypothetical protein